MTVASDSVLPRPNTGTWPDLILHLSIYNDSHTFEFSNSTQVQDIRSISGSHLFLSKQRGQAVLHSFRLGDWHFERW